MTRRNQQWREVDRTEGNPIVPTPKREAWYVATCQTGAERSAVAALSRYGHKAWFPQMTRWTVDVVNFRRVKLNSAVFGGYIFVSPCSKDDLVPAAADAADITGLALSQGHISRGRAQRSSAGVTEAGQWIKWMTGEREASRISAAKVEALSDAQTRGTFIRWENAPTGALRPGDIVTPKAGALAGLEGVVDLAAADRARVFLTIFGRVTPVDMDVADLRKVA
jgi:transcription antitermination factor NusG